MKKVLAITLTAAMIAGSLSGCGSSGSGGGGDVGSYIGSDDSRRGVHVRIR